MKSELGSTKCSLAQGDCGNGGADWIFQSGCDGENGFALRG